MNEEIVVFVLVQIVWGDDDFYIVMKFVYVFVIENVMILDGVGYWFLFVVLNIVVNVVRDVSQFS